MKKLGRKVTAAVAAAGLTLSTFASTAFGATTVEISDSGAFSDNTVRVNQDQRISVDQRNRADIQNSVDVDANTGNNRANFNTDGDVSIRTGDVDTSVDISNRANVNQFHDNNDWRDNNNHNNWDWKRDFDKDKHNWNNFIVVKHGNYDKDKHHNNYDYDKDRNHHDSMRLQATMNGEKEVPGPGDPNGYGNASVWINPYEDRLCSMMRVHNIDDATAAHIHHGLPNQAGPIVVTLPTPNNDGYANGCVSAEGHLLDKISDKPWHYYVNVHNNAYPDGAIRGQLSQ